jgi:chromosome segregation ATPase
MKKYLSKVLVVVSAFLAVALVVTKHTDNTHMQTDAGTINDYSNRLDSAQVKISLHEGTILTLSNSLVECGSASLAVSNRLTETIALQTEQITNLNYQISAMASESKALSRSVIDLTNQMTSLKNQIALTEASLAKTNQDLIQANKDYALLQNRFLRMWPSGWWWNENLTIPTSCARNYRG